MSDMLTRIDAALVANPLLSSGYAAYAELLDRYDKTVTTNPASAEAALVDGMVAIAAQTYCRDINPTPSLLSFSDGANMCLFDQTNERTVMMWGATRDVAPNSRDTSYHAGYPRAGDGYDKGHALSHAQGGLEGGPNYFLQRASVNRRLSNTGHLWRDIETFMAANAGLLAFVRLIYAKGDRGDRPMNVEYNLLAGRRQFRSVIFPN